MPLVSSSPAPTSNGLPVTRGDTTNSRQYNLSDAMAQAGKGQTGNYYVNNGNGTTWMRPYGGDNTSWMYGADSPTAGIDQRAWGNVANPNAFEYAGKVGGAASEASRYANMGLAAQARSGPQMSLGEYNTMMGAEDRSRDSQQRALDMVEASANGLGPSAAQAQLQGGLASSMRNSLALAAQARGGGAASVAAQQNASQQNMAASSAANFQGAQLRAQEQMNAQSAFAQQSTAMRASDLQRAGLSAQMAFQQAQLESAQRAQNQQAQLGYEGMRQGVYNSQLSAQQAGEQQNAGTGATQAAARFAADQASNAMYRQLIGGAMTAAGTAGGAMIGGPAGAAAGNMAGTAAGSAINDEAFGSDSAGASGRFMT